MSTPTFPTAASWCSATTTSSRRSSTTCSKTRQNSPALYLGVTTLNGKALISVRNEGETIPAEEIPLLFERFHKSDKSRSEDKDGVGLGLYVVKTILDQHKEHIAVTSENGLTTFTFSVTLAGGQTAQ